MAIVNIGVLVSSFHRKIRAVAINIGVLSVGPIR